MTTDPTHQSLARQLEEALERSRAESLGKFPPRTLAWLALLPEWTDTLADRVGFGKPHAADQVVKDLISSGIAESRVEIVRGGGTRTYFWAREGIRKQIGEYLRKHRPAELPVDLHTLAGALRDLEPPEPSLARWLHVATTAPELLRLVDTVDRLLHDRRTDEAWTLIGAARVVGEVLGDVRREEAQRAQWRLDRRHRVERDEQALTHYISRPVIESAFDELLLEDNRQWALHLLGDGGVGKTMAVRYLTSGRYTADRGLPAVAVARVDFDHLDPSYPVQRPGQLFLALADDLRGFAGSRKSSQAYRELAFASIALQEELAKQVPDQAHVEQHRAEIVRRFAEYLYSIPQWVVLVLDTCEELAKLYAPGAGAPAIEQTFELLAALHEEYRELRVVLAGRRWLTPAPEERQRAAGPSLVPRSYVEVLEIGGFTRREALDYLEVRTEAALEAAEVEAWIDADPEEEPPASDSTGAPRHVLVIGSQSPSMGLLSRLNAEARTLGRALLRIGECRPALSDGRAVLSGNLTKTEVEQALREAISRASQAGALLVLSFLGHGFSVDGSERLYLMTHESDLGPAVGGIDIGTTIDTAANRPGVRGVIAIVDLCRSGLAPAASLIPNVDGLRHRTSVGILAAGSANRPADDLALSRAVTEVLSNGVEGASAHLGLEEVVDEIRSRGQAALPVVSSQFAAADSVGERLWLGHNRRFEDQAPSLLAPRLRDAILDRVRADGPGGTRYNPFDLDAYCSWALADPALTVEKLAEGADPYVEQRILERTQPVARAALPAAVTFGRFDLDLITPALRRAMVDPLEAFNALATYEWVNTVQVEGGRPKVIEVDEHLRDRIRSVLMNSESWQVDDRARLGADARALLLDAPRLADLTAAPVEAAVRLLPVEAAAELWEQLEKRITEEGAWGWAAQIADRVANVTVETARAGSPPGIERPESRGPSILAAVRATLAAARLHTGRTDDLSAIWSDARRAIDDYPEVPGRARLAARIRLGLVVCGVETVPDSLELEVLEVLCMTAPLDASLAAAEFLVETLPVGPELKAVDEVLRRIEERSSDPAFKACASIGRGVVQLRARDGDFASMALSLARHAMNQAAAGDSARAKTWTDWVAPIDWAVRAYLATLLAAAEIGQDAVDLTELWIPNTAQGRIGIDVERAVAAAVRLRLGFQRIAPEELEEIEPAVAYQPGRRPTHWLHRRVGPLAVEVAQALDVAGEPHRAERLLRNHLEAAIAAGDDPDTIEQCQLGLLRLCRVHRTLRFEPSAERLAREGSPAVRTEAWQTLVLINGKRPWEPEEVDFHTWWTCQDVETLARVGNPLSGWDGALETAGDLMEVLEYQKTRGVRAKIEVDLPPNPPSHDEEAVRQIYLRYGKESRSRMAPSPPGTFGRTALRAGELMALRLPQRAVELLLMAAESLTEAGDRPAADRATLLAALAVARAGDYDRARRILRDLNADYESSVGPAWEDRRWRIDEITFSRGAAAAAASGSPELGLLPAKAETETNRSRLWIYGRRGIVFAAALAPLSLVVPSRFWAAIFLVGSYVLLGSALLLGLRSRRTRTIRIEPNGATGVRSVVWHGPTGVAFGDLVSGWPDPRPKRLPRALWAMFNTGAVAPRAFRAESQELELADASSELQISRPGKRRLTWRGAVFVQLEIDPVLEEHPWERWFMVKAGIRARVGDSGLYCYRRAPFQEDWFAQRSAWRSNIPDYRGPRHLAPHDWYGRLFEDGPQKQPVLYLIGTPIETTGGWRLNLATTSRTSTDESPPSTRSGGGDLFSPTAESVSGRALVVFQAEPVEGPPRRFHEHSFSGYVKLAGAAIEAGAGTVLVVPPLPDTLAASVISSVAKRIAQSDKWPVPSRYLALMMDLHRLVALNARPNTEATDRPDLDLLLFLRTPPFRRD